MARPNGTLELDGAEFDTAQVGELQGKIDFRRFAPYVGLGWGNAVGKGKALGLAFDIGVAFQGTPEVALRTVGTDPRLTNDPTFQQALAQEEQELQEALDELEYYPVVSLGLNYQF